MVEMSNSYSYELLKAFNELLACDLTESMWIILKRMRELVLMQQAIQRLLVKTIVLPSNFSWDNMESVLVTEDKKPKQTESTLLDSAFDSIVTTTPLGKGCIKSDAYIWDEEDVPSETLVAEDLQAIR